MQYFNEQGSFDTYRLFVSLLGYVDIVQGSQEDKTKNAKFHKLDRKDPGFRSFLNHLDKDVHYRLPLKVGVLYVKQDQTTQRDILFNTEGSPAYEDFLANLGK